MWLQKKSLYAPPRPAGFPVPEELTISYAAVHSQLWDHLTLDTQKQQSRLRRLQPTWTGELLKASVAEGVTEDHPQHHSAIPCRRRPDATRAELGPRDASPQGERDKKNQGMGRTLLGGDEGRARMRRGKQGMRTGKGGMGIKGANEGPLGTEHTT